jgi:hypothetical protein
MCCMPARAIVSVLRPGRGRTNRRESEDELRHRLAEDGAQVKDDNLGAALKLLEGNGDPEGFDNGAVPCLPYRVVRPPSELPRTWRNPRPPKPVVLEDLRAY